MSQFNQFATSSFIIFYNVMFDKRRSKGKLGRKISGRVSNKIGLFNGITITFMLNIDKSITNCINSYYNLMDIKIIKRFNI